MQQICQLGFRCPYKHYGEGEELCTYPYIRITEREEDETFGFPEEGDCPLLCCDSELDNLLLVYQISDKVKDLIAEEQKVLEEENHQLMFEITKKPQK